MAPICAKEMANAFRTVRKNTIQIAEEIPKTNDFAPHPGTRSVRDTPNTLAFLNLLHYDFHATAASRPSRDTTFPRS